MSQVRKVNSDHNVNTLAFTSELPRAEVVELTASSLKAYRLDLLNSPLILQYAPKSSAASDQSPSSNKLYLCPFSVFGLLLHAARLPVSPLELLNSEHLSPIHIQHRPSVLNNHLNLGHSKWVTLISLSPSPSWEPRFGWRGWQAGYPGVVLEVPSCEATSPGMTHNSVPLSSCQSRLTDASAGHTA